MNFTTKDIGLIDPGSLLVFGGVYSNLEALLALKAKADNLQIPPDRIICTGDIVAYCADPEACVQLIRDWGIHCIAGNVEIQLRERQDDCGCNFEEETRCDIFSRHWYPYARRMVSEEALEWMETLPHHLTFQFGNKKFRVVHGSYFGVSEYVFASTSTDHKTRNFEASKSDVILAGHCGLPFGEKIGNYIWWNAGVIGMPANDGTTRIWFSTIYWAGENSPMEFRHHPLHFDESRTHQKMIANELPTEYAETLMTGLWDNCEILPDAETKIQGIPLVLDDKLIC
ncbi:MAG: metallophosphoesterase [Saprospiraceae bacterium]|nr:metallophosphoesterase [Saprospiraceae bacterium]